jgi:hypothetical protein
MRDPGGPALSTGQNAGEFSSPAIPGLAVHDQRAVPVPRPAMQPAQREQGDRRRRQRDAAHRLALAAPQVHLAGGGILPLAEGRSLLASSWSSRAVCVSECRCVQPPIAGHYCVSFIH